MSGLLAGAMLRDECAGIVEAQEGLPNNHSAVLRFRSETVSDVLNIPFQKVKVLKAVEPWKNPIADALAYSHKCNGLFSMRSSITANGQIEERFLAPGDLIARMAEKVSCPIQFNTNFDFDTSHKVISTMPMPSLMEALGWNDRPDFKFRQGVNITATIENCDVCCSLYIPDPDFPASRISISGDRLIVECNVAEEYLGFMATDIIEIALKKLGIWNCGEGFSDMEIKPQPYSKILPIPEAERKRFILWASEKKNVYSLGRFATWRPGLLLDDIVNDIRVIHRLINGESTYGHTLKG